MESSWLALAERIEQQPWNRPGTDKTWVLNALASHQRLLAEVRAAGRPKDVEFLRAFRARVDGDD